MLGKRSIVVLRPTTYPKPHAAVSAHVAPPCRCGRDAKYVALLHYTDRCNRVETFSLTPDGARIEMVCLMCLGELADRTKRELAVRRHPASGSKMSCESCRRALESLHDLLEIQAI